MRAAPVRLTVLAAAAFAAVYALFVLTEPGQRLDEAALAGTGGVPRSAREAADGMLRIVSIGTIAAAVTLLSALAWLRRDARLLMVPAAIVGLSLVAAEALKLAILPRPALVPDPHLAGNSYPSGHTTVAAAIGLSLVVVASRRHRRWAAIVATALMGAAGVFVLTAEWHRPSDAVGAYLLTLVVAGAVATWAATARGVRRGGAKGEGSGSLWAGAELTAAGVGLAIMVAALGYATLRYGGEVSWARVHVAYLAAAAATVLAAGACVGALVRALERLDPQAPAGGHEVASTRPTLDLGAR